MSLTIEQMKDWVEDLAGKNRDLHSKIRELEEENKKLRMKNKKLTDELRKQKMSSGHDVEGHEQGKPPRRKQRKVNVASAVSESDHQMQVTLALPSVPITKIAKANSLDMEKGKPPPRKQRKIIVSAAVSTKNDRQMPAMLALPSVPITEVAKANLLDMEKTLGLVMGYVRPMDLLSCRQVSKLWKKATEKDFHERMTFYIDDNHLALIEKFMEYARNGFPMFRNLKLDLGRSWPGIKESVRKLFIGHGKTLHKLQLNICGQFPMNTWHMGDLRDIFLGSLEEIRELEIHASPMCPLQGNQLFLPHHTRNVLQNLSIMKLELNCNDSDSVGDKIQFFLHLLHLAPNLKALIWGSNEQYLDIQLIQCLIHVNPPNLENLFIHNWIPESAVVSLGNSQLKLKELYLDDFKDFGLKFRPSGKSEVTPRQISYGPRISGVYLKNHLENILSQFTDKDMSCTRLLQIFTSALADKLRCLNGNK